jgi:hypothetical protein
MTTATVRSWGSLLDEVVGDPDYVFDGLNIDINDSGTIVCGGYIIKK